MVAKVWQMGTIDEKLITSYRSARGQERNVKNRDGQEAIAALTDQDYGYEVIPHLTPTTSARNDGFSMTESVAYKPSRNMSSTSEDQNGGYATIVWRQI